MTQENLLPGVSVLFNIPDSSIGAQQRGFRLVLRAPAGGWAGAMAPRHATAELHVLTASPRWWPPQEWVRQLTSFLLLSWEEAHLPCQVYLTDSAWFCAGHRPRPQVRITDDTGHTRQHASTGSGRHSALWQ